MSRMSIATIDKPEFINLTPRNPLISECEIKVMYVGENRNRSYISKEVATEMANTLPGCPIVGYYKEEKGDFADHGDVVIMDDEGIHFKSMTKPYGFVAPDAKVWFQKFEETDDFGNIEIREYLMTTGYLWTGQYEECQSIVESGKPHSMELDPDTLNGKWATNKNTGIDFFIINDAVFSKLCVLGDDVEPCFEGSSVTAPEVSLNFSKEVDDTFKKTLFSMMQELKFALKGEQENMVYENLEVTQDNVEQSDFVENQNLTEDSADNAFAASEKEKEEEESSKEESTESKEEEEKEDKYAKSEEEEDKKDESSEEEKSEDSEDKKDEEEEDKYAKSEEEDKKDEEPEKEEDKEDKYALLQQDFEKLQSEYSSLESKYNELLTFKAQIENQQKEELINSFYMLSEEDKKDIFENREKYTLEDIEKELALICVRKKVNFDLEDVSKNDNKEESPITTFNLDEPESTVPDWINAIRNTQKSRNV